MRPDNAPSNNLSLSPEHCFARNSLPGNLELADLKIFEQLLTQQNKHNRILYFFHTDLSTNRSV